jgi:hypothetical protein
MTVLSARSRLYGRWRRGNRFGGNGHFRLRCGLCRFSFSLRSRFDNRSGFDSRSCFGFGRRFNLGFGLGCGLGLRGSFRCNWGGCGLCRGFHHLRGLDLLYTGADGTTTRWIFSGLPGAMPTSRRRRPPLAPACPASLAAWPGDFGCVFCNLIASIDYGLSKGMSREEAEAAGGLILPRQALFCLPECLSLYLGPRDGDALCASGPPGRAAHRGCP